MMTQIETEIVFEIDGKETALIVEITEDCYQGEWIMEDFKIIEVRKAPDGMTEDAIYDYLEQSEDFLHHEFMVQLRHHEAMMKDAQYDERVNK